MLELLIVRHAIAFERDPARWPDDARRPLSPEGKRKFRRGAAGLARWVPEVDVHLASPLVRARQTARILTDVAGWPEASAHPELEPGTDPAATLASLRPGKARRIALVGHEPHLSQFVAVCVAGSANGTAVELKKGAAALVRFPEAVRPGAGILVALVPPKVLRQMAQAA